MSQLEGPCQKHPGLSRNVMLENLPVPGCFVEDIARRRRPLLKGVFAGNHQINRQAQGSDLADEAVGFLVTVLQLGLHDEEIQVAALAGIAARV